MNVGTKSLLFGAHQFVWHPITVFLAWCELYGIPTWKEMICIFIHDWGYWGCDDMEGSCGSRHPERGAKLAAKYLDHFHPMLYDVNDREYRFLCLYHSRTYAAKGNSHPSKLCWADKLCVKFDPWWLYLPRVILTGEIHEYRKEAHDAGLIPIDKSNREWFNWAQERMIRKAHEQDVRPPYQRGS